MSEEEYVEEEYVEDEGYIDICEEVCEKGIIVSFEDYILDCECYEEDFEDLDLELEEEEEYE